MCYQGLTRMWQTRRVMSSVTVAFYVTGHGLGHGTRVAEVRPCSRVAWRNDAFACESASSLLASSVESGWCLGCCR